MVVPQLAVRTEDISLRDGYKITLTIVGDGSRPVLLFIVGSSGLGKLYHRLATKLSSRFQCVYYDKRGFQSAPTPKQDTTQYTNKPISTRKHAGDAAAIVEHLSPSQAAYVFGTSTGATVALDMLLRYPDLVHTAVLHEPIVFSVVPAQDGREKMVALYRQMENLKDPFEALEVFAKSGFTQAIGQSTIEQVDRKSTQNPTTTAARNARPDPVQICNARQTHFEATTMLEYTVDIEQARRLSGKIMLLSGRESRNLPVSVPVRSLASALGNGIKVWDVPGGHADFASKAHATLFSETLMSLLQHQGRIDAEVGRGHFKI